MSRTEEIVKLAADGHKQAVIAKRLGLSQGRVSQILKAAHKGELVAKPRAERKEAPPAVKPASSARERALMAVPLMPELPKLDYSASSCDPLRQQLEMEYAARVIIRETTLKYNACEDDDDRAEIYADLRTAKTALDSILMMGPAA